MTTTETNMTEAEFDAAYPLKPNHLNPHASWTIDGVGYLFETYGEELDFIRSQDPSTVWTILDEGDGNIYIASGYHFVNRIGFLLSTVPVPRHQSILVRIPIDSEIEEGEQP